jgi:cephalosporin hydroxylase
MDQLELFQREVDRNIDGLASDESLWEETLDWMHHSGVHKYTYNFSWLGRPIIQYPQDMVAFQEIVWRVRPDLIIETGVAHGGSLMLSASLLALLDRVDELQSASYSVRTPRKVLGIDIDIREHNKREILAHPLSPYIQLIQGSSVASDIVEQVTGIASGYKRVLVCLDSDHTCEHVLRELVAYAPLVTSGSYCIVYDTVVEYMRPEFRTDRSWGPGNSPLTAVQMYLADHPGWAMDRAIDQKLQITVARCGFLRKL